MKNNQTALEGLHSTKPVRCGMIENFEAMEKVWQHFSPRIRRESEVDGAVLLTEPVLCPKSMSQPLFLKVWHWSTQSIVLSGGKYTIRWHLREINKRITRNELVPNSPCSLQNFLRRKCGRGVLGDVRKNKKNGIVRKDSIVDSNCRHTATTCSRLFCLVIQVWERVHFCSALV